jgi:hypothetical protein
VAFVFLGYVIAKERSDIIYSEERSEGFAGKSLTILPNLRNGFK